MTIYVIAGSKREFEYHYRGITDAVYIPNAWALRGLRLEPADNDRFEFVGTYRERSDYPDLARMVELIQAAPDSQETST